MIMKVVDNNTHEVVNQIPSKQVMDMIAQFSEMAGLVLDKKA
jgi:flagellar protein FlaG